MITNAFSSFWAWLETCLTWFFPPALLEDAFISLVVKGLEFFFGCWLLYILLLKPILMLFKYIDSKVYR